MLKPSLAVIRMIQFFYYKVYKGKRFILYTKGIPSKSCRKGVVKYLKDGLRNAIWPDSPFLVRRPRSLLGVLVTIHGHFISNVILLY